MLGLFTGQSLSAYTVVLTCRSLSCVLLRDSSRCWWYFQATEHSLKPGFHYPSCELTARVHGPSWRPEFTGVKKCNQVDGPSTRVHFLTPKLCIFWHPSTRAVNLGVKKCTRVHGPSTRPVNSGSGNRALIHHSSILPDYCQHLRFGCDCCQCAVVHLTNVCVIINLRLVHYLL